MNASGDGARIARDFVRFALANKVYWLTPLVLVSLLLLGLLLATSTPLSPFIYRVV